MAGIKITDLPSANTLDGTEQLAVVQSSTTKVTTVDDITTNLTGNFPANSEFLSLSSKVDSIDGSNNGFSAAETYVRAASASLVDSNESNSYCCTQTFGKIEGNCAAIGYLNTATGGYTASVGGYYNDASGGGSGVLAGNNNDVHSNFSAIAGGTGNCIASFASDSGIYAGCGNKICSPTSAIIGGTSNNVTVSHTGATIIGGTSITSVSSNMVHMEKLQLNDIPSTDPGVPGVIYNDGSDLKISTTSGGTVDNVTVSDTAGTASTFTSASNLYFSVDNFTYGPVAASVQGNYYKPTIASTDELSVAFYSDADAIEIKIERSQSSLQVFVDDVPVHEFAVAGYQNRLLKLTHGTAKIRKYELRGKSYGFGGVYTDASNETYQVWPYETRRERPLLLVMTDSYGTAFNSIYGLSFAEKLANFLDMDLHSDALNSSGWSSTGSSSTSTRSASQAAISRDPDVILACLGYNDKSSPNQTNIEAGINGWHSTITSTFASANIMLASPWTPVGAEAGLTTVSGYIQGRATALGADFIDINGAVTSDSSSLYTSDDSTHPNQAGHEYLARRIEALMLRTGNVPSTY